MGCVAGHGNKLRYCKVHDVVYCRSCGVEYGRPMFRYTMPTAHGDYEFYIPVGHSNNNAPHGTRMYAGHEKHA